jgi:hypothetical protein
METRKLHQLKRNAYLEYFGVRPGHIKKELDGIRKEMNLVINTPTTQETN